jgi:hypothetical protein
VALLDALRALASFDPPRALPECDLDELAGVLDAHGLAPIASYHLETRRIGAGVPDAFRARLLAVYQGVVNDNVFKLVTLKQALAPVTVRAVLLGAVAYLDWLYPHLAFRPVGDPRLLVRGEDGARFAAELGADFRPEAVGEGGHVATFTNGQFPIRIQEGLAAGSGDDHGLAARAGPLRVMGPSAARPALEDALPAAAADLAAQGLYAPIVEYVDLRELVRLAADEPSRAAAARERAAAAGLDRGLFGALAVVERYFPETAAACEALRPRLGAAERAAVLAVAEAASDPKKLRVLRGAEAAARAIVGPR